MNYDMQGMKLIPELFAVLKTAKGRNQGGASSVDGLTRPLVSRSPRAKKGNFMDGKPVAAPVKEPKVEPKPETKCFYCKGNGHW